MANVSTIPALVLLAVLFVVSLAVFFWALYTRSTAYTRDLDVSQSPFCMDIVCPGNTTPTPVHLNSHTYQTVNFCTTNAPPTSFLQSLKVCGGDLTDQEITAPTQQTVRSFADFYNNHYISTCGYNWKIPPPQSDTDDVQPDPTIPALVECASKLGIGSDPNVAALRQLCGPSCV